MAFNVLYHIPRTGDNVATRRLSSAFSSPFQTHLEPFHKIWFLRMILDLPECSTSCVRTQYAQLAHTRRAAACVQRKDPTSRRRSCRRAEWGLFLLDHCWLVVMQLLRCAVRGASRGFAERLHVCIRRDLCLCMSG